MNMLRIVLSLLLLTSCALAGEADLRELYGTCDGQPFWLRWQAPSAAFGNHRVLQLVYTPPKPESLDGTQLVDCPFILLDSRTRVMAWNGRGTLSFIEEWNKPNGYRVSCELKPSAGDDQQIKTREHRTAIDPSWDLHLLPLHLALAWRVDGKGSEIAVDLFSPRPSAPHKVIWAPGILTINGVPWKAEPDQQGRLARLQDAAGRDRLLVAGRKP